MLIVIATLFDILCNGHIIGTYAPATYLHNIGS